MSLRVWLRERNLYDKDVEEIFTKYDIGIPEEDLLTISPKKFKKIKDEIMVERRKNIKDSLTLMRLESKLNKLTDIYTNIRKKNKKDYKIIINKNNINNKKNKENITPEKKKIFKTY